MSLQSILNKPAALDNKSLNLYCNTVTCNELITPVAPDQKKCWKMGMPLNATVPLANGTYTTPCSLDLIPNPDSSILANTYTAPRAEFISVYASLRLVPISGSGDVQIRVLRNGSEVEGLVGIWQTNSGGSSAGWSCAISGLVELALGDVLSVAFTFGSFGSGWFWGEGTFCGQVI